MSSNIIHLYTRLTIQFSGFLEHAGRWIQAPYTATPQGKATRESTRASAKIEQPLASYTETVWGDACKEVRWKSRAMGAVIGCRTAKVYFVHRSLPEGVHRYKVPLLRQEVMWLSDTS